MNETQQTTKATYDPRVKEFWEDQGNDDMKPTLHPVQQLPGGQGR
jgi:hypothetical protein